MNGPNPTRWAGVCAGGYFAAAATYVGNAAAMATIRAADVLLILVLGSLPVICVTMGCQVLAGKRWAPKLAVVVAGGFAAIHVIGLAYLFLAAPTAVSVLTRSLQWQLGGAFVVLWLSILCFSFRFANAVEKSAT
jgi:hypothetical protein